MITKEQFKRNLNRRKEKEALERMFKAYSDAVLTRLPETNLSDSAYTYSSRATKQ